jgi:hypothetical protein
VQPMVGGLDGCVLRSTVKIAETIDVERTSSIAASPSSAVDDVDEELLFLEAWAAAR